MVGSQLYTGQVHCPRYFEMRSFYGLDFSCLLEYTSCLPWRRHRSALAVNHMSCVRASLDRWWSKEENGSPCADTLKARHDLIKQFSWPFMLDHLCVKLHAGLDVLFFIIDEFLTHIVRLCRTRSAGVTSSSNAEYWLFRQSLVSMDSCCLHEINLSEIYSKWCYTYSSQLIRYECMVISELIFCSIQATYTPLYERTNATEPKLEFV